MVASPFPVVSGFEHVSPVWRLGPVVTLPLRTTWPSTVRQLLKAEDVETLMFRGFIVAAGEKVRVDVPNSQMTLTGSAARAAPTGETRTARNAPRNSTFPRRRAFPPATIPFMFMMSPLTGFRPAQTPKRRQTPSQ